MLPAHALVLNLRALSIAATNRVHAATTKKGISIQKRMLLSKPSAPMQARGVARSPRPRFTVISITPRKELSSLGISTLYTTPTCGREGRRIVLGLRARGRVAAEGVNFHLICHLKREEEEAR